MIYILYTQNDDLDIFKRSFDDSDLLNKFSKILQNCIRFIEELAWMSNWLLSYFFLLETFEDRFVLIGIVTGNPTGQCERWILPDVYNFVGNLEVGK